MLNPSEIKGAIEAMLFIANAPVTVKAIAAALEIDAKAAAGYIKELAGELRAKGRGILIIETDGAYQMCTNPAYYPFVSQLAADAPKSLTMPLLETLAIIVCKQPVCKADIEAVRGVDATHAVNRLLEYGLIEEKGRSRAPGRPILFGATERFFAHFGISNMSQFQDMGAVCTLFT